MDASLHNQPPDELALEQVLSALAQALRDTTSRFETIGGRIARMVLVSGQAADHDLIVALQDFDRLQQEFAAIGGVILQCANAAGESPPELRRAVAMDALSPITISDLKQRLLDHMQQHDPAFDMTPDETERVF